MSIPPATLATASPSRSLNSGASLPSSRCRLLTTFTQHSFKAHDLKAAIPLRANTGYNSQHTENLTRFTQDVTNMTGHSDSGLVMDPEDRDRAAEDLQGFKVRSSTTSAALPGLTLALLDALFDSLSHLH